ncbi:MAG: hypothetical protein RIB59_03845, partial [Rhodospirillales bacterium]
MNKLLALTSVVALCAAPKLSTATPIDGGAHLIFQGERQSVTAQSVQAQAPGRPTTPKEKEKAAPKKPNKDPLVKRPPPSPGKPNFPERPANKPPLK